jgi:hypothetical protein
LITQHQFAEGRGVAFSSLRNQAMIVVTHDGLLQIGTQPG